MNRLVIMSLAAALFVAACTRSSEEASESKASATAPPPAVAAPQPPAPVAAPAADLPPPARVDSARLLAADSEAGQWMSYNRSYNEQRFSPLRQITTDNVAQLGLAWYADFDTRRAQEATPLVIDGVIYVSTAWSKVNAYEAATGRLLWQFDPHVPGETAVNACCDVVNRGVAAWLGRLFIGTLDGRLIAIDAKTGTAIWEVQTTDRSQQYTITGAPRVVKGKVIIGQGGAEYGVRGYVSAYDADTGKMLWRWYTVPGNPADGFENAQMEMAAKTWGGEWWKQGGGGTVWDGITYDPQTDLLYIGVGNGSPWPAEVRSPGDGDNLFLSSIVALKPDTGEYVWHYQEVQRDSWDYTATQQMVIADLQIAGAKRHVLMQAPKNGYFYVLDALTGALISAKPYVDLNWSTGIDMKTGRPIMVPGARYDKTGEPFIMRPNSDGAHQWQPMSFDPQTGLVYIPAMINTHAFVLDRSASTVQGQKLSISLIKGDEIHKQNKELFIDEGFLLAWDPVNQREKWRVKYGPYGRGGGVLATAGGLVFQGLSNEEKFVAYRADDGQLLWSMAAHTGIGAGPVSFELNGEQYVAVVAGERDRGNYYSPNYSRLLVFKLGGTVQLPAPVDVPHPELNPPKAFGSDALISKGGELFSRACASCHATDTRTRGLFPDLRYSAALNDAGTFRAIVIDGALTANGMVSFARSLTPEDAEAVRAWLVSRARAAKATQSGALFFFHRLVRRAACAVGSEETCERVTVAMGLDESRFDK